IVVFSSKSSFTRTCERRGKSPPCRNIAKHDPHRKGTRIDRIHQNLRQIKECMMGIQLRVVRPWSVCEDFILNPGALVRPTNTPPALVHQLNWKILARGTPGPDPVQVLREITNLIKCVPNGELQLSTAGAWGKINTHVHTMRSWIC